MKLSIDELERLSTARRRTGGGLREEVAALSEGDPLKYDSYMQKTRYDMWMISLKGG